MNENIRSMINWSLIWALVIGISLFLVNFLTHGFFFKYLKVKLSRGKYLLVEVNTLVGKYLTTGHLSEDMLVFKKRNIKNKTRIPQVPEGSIYRFLGVEWVSIDERTNAIFAPDLTGVEGFDGETMENLYKRALYTPKWEAFKDKLLTYLMIACLISIIVVGIMVYQTYKQALGLVTI